MKRVLILICILLIVPAISATNLTVKSEGYETSVTDLNTPIKFNLEVTNNEKTDYFKFYNLLGFDIEPSEEIKINSGETKKIEITIIPREDFNYEGFYIFQYFINDAAKNAQQEQLTIKFVSLKDAFEIGTSEIDPESNKITVYIKNKENIDFEEVKTKFSSAFFNFDEEFKMGPNQKKEFEVQLNKEDFDELLAGFYTLTVDLEAKGKETKIEGIIKFAEKDILISTSREYGLFVNTKIINKTNEGNVVSLSTTEINKNLISRLFTRFSPEPDIIEREGFNINYMWNTELNPGENMEIRVKTNWFFPFIIILLIIATTILAKKYSLKPLQLTKRVSFVRTKGGEFALKVTIKIKARQYVERINVIDRLPHLVKLYDNFGIQGPSKIDEKNRRIEWDFHALDVGETRVVSYIVYSKVGVLGKFALPSTTAVYEKNGKVHEVKSNRAFFVSEQQKGAEEDY